MTKGRLEAFSDGVIAIIITVMVLELKVPHGNDLAALRPMAPLFCAYVLSFVHVGIYWNNHHHMLAVAERVNGKVLWANLHLLFWLSLVPFTTAWMGETHIAPLPTAVYGMDLLGAGFGYLILSRALINTEGRESTLGKALGADRKGTMSALLYVLGVGVAFFQPLVATAIYAAVAMMWLIPDRRIEDALDG